MAKICIFCQQIAKKNILNFLKNSIPGAKHSLKCENFGQFHFFIVFFEFGLFWQQESNFWSISNILIEFLWPFLTKMQIFAINQHLHVVES